MERDLPEGVIDADPPGGWEQTHDGEASEQNADAAGSPELADDPDAEGLLSDTALAPDDPAAGEQARQGADPDMSTDRGEEP
ncbi:hypothetical protein [Microbacterium sp. SLBN-146]|uniref:hypothetical protein n=1 Tax=Microbacterium sp. SLBN-146 TaxID=2768457 RepID=UPI00114E3A1A|nr:hypothetical protein [Microbacterium sp. SLBN-146]TQJ30980.1 hypothetical protein FBY39_1439 [Microbacterium sp. SLBN-146]